MLWKERGASLFTHFRPFFCTFFLSKSPHLFSYKAFSFFQQALFTREKFGLIFHKFTYKKNRQLNLEILIDQAFHYSTTYLIKTNLYLKSRSISPQRINNFPSAIE